MTKDSFGAARRGVLQLLRPAQTELVAILGKHSGYQENDPIGSNKAQACATAGWPWINATEFAGMPVQLLPQCALYMVLEQESSSAAAEPATTRMDAGDHVVVLCRVVRTGKWDETRKQIVPLTDAEDDDDGSATLKSGLGPDQVLYTGYLRQAGLL